jgi:hypothetical protein
MSAMTRAPVMARRARDAAKVSTRRRRATTATRWGRARASMDDDDARSERRYVREGDRNVDVRRERVRGREARAGRGRANAAATRERDD